MICPYCCKEMKYGVIQSQHEIFFGISYTKNLLKVEIINLTFRR